MSLSEVPVNNKEENAQGFCPNYVQEFGLCSTVTVYSIGRSAFSLVAHVVWGGKSGYFVVLTPFKAQRT
jgi:hypothetical protein